MSAAAQEEAELCLLEDECKLSEDSQTSSGLEIVTPQDSESFQHSLGAAQAKKRARGE